MAVPNFQTIDIANIRENSPQPTTDVTFIFVDQNSGEKKELHAHKLLLAFGSEVFMTQFFGSFKEERNAIPVEDASFDAFKIFLDVLYNKRISIRQASYKLLAELFYLGGKYLMVEMQQMIIREIDSRKMVPGMLIEAAKVAEENAQIMEKFSESIIRSCAFFVKDNIQSVLEIFKNEEAGGSNSLILHRLLARCSQATTNQGDVCNNCKHRPCLTGRNVTMENFAHNAQVENVSLTYKQMGRKTTCNVVVKRDGKDFLLATYPQRSVEVLSIPECKFSCI